MRQVGIFHRDISFENIMVRRCDGEVHGVLNDFDLALDLYIKKSEADKSRAQITGTRLFMAHELLDPKSPAVHSGRHDMESLFWVVVWFIFRYRPSKGGGTRGTPRIALDDWLVTSDLASKKSGFLFKPLTLESDSVWEKSWKTWVRVLSRLHHDAITARQRLLEDMHDAEVNNPMQRELIISRIGGLVFRDDSTAWKAFLEAITGESPEDYPLDTSRFVEDYDLLSAIIL